MLLILKLAIILLIPSLFFSYVGHDPLRETKNQNVKSIALVNEDVGFEFEKNPLTLGKEMSEVIGKSSSYQWVTVNRKTAETGLHSGQYEAIIYLPSNFTESVLSFTDDQPKEAAVTYKIQPNINAERAEKVLKELETAKNKINTNMSTIYWNYVSQSVDDIRKKFDGILEKEVTFQNTMYEFYTPSSQSLTSEIGSQKQLLDGILSTASTASQATGDSINSASANKSEIETFLSDIQSFKEYQLNQNALMETATLENQKLVTDSLLAYDSVIKEGVSNITSNGVSDLLTSQEEGQKLYEDVTAIQQQLETSNKTLEELTETIGSSNTKEQFDRLLQLQRDNMKLFKAQSVERALNDLQPTLISSREKLRTSSSSNHDELSLPEYIPSTIDVNEMENTIIQLESVATAIKETDSALFEKITQSINELRSNLQLLKEKVEGQKTEQQQWINQVNETIASNQSATNISEQHVAEIIVEKIKTKEQQLLQIEGLSENRKTLLSDHFSREMMSRNMNDLLQYYNDLALFEGQLSYLQTKDETVIENIIANTEDSEAIEAAFEQIKEETQLFYQLNGTLNDSITDMNHLEEDFFAYTGNVFNTIEEYQSQFEQYQSVIVENLTSMEGSIRLVSDHLVQEMNTPTFELAPESETGGEFLLQMHDQSFGALQAISQMVDGIATQQDTIREQTDDLYSSVSTVQQKVDDLNDRWTQNVDTTKQVRGDVYNILGNTLVDEQENPFMYQFLSNPVKMSGDVFKEKVTPTPPVIMLIIILICSLLIGLFLHQYRGVNRIVHLLLFLLMTITIGLIISIYGLNIYTMPESQAVKWTVLTILLVMTLVSILRFAFYVGSFIGSLITVLFIAFFTTPLLDLVLPNFSVEHPIANLFLNIQLGDNDGLNLMLILLLFLTVLCSSIVYIRTWNSESSEETLADES